MAVYQSLNGKWLSYGLVTVQMACLVILALTGRWLAENVEFLIWEAMGVGLGVWALWTIRPRDLNIFPEVRRGSRLVTHGPYRVIRHPMYAALLLVTLALVLDDFSLTRCWVWFLLLVDLLVKLTYEEKLLAGHFPEYSEYQRRSSRLVPWVF